MGFSRDRQKKCQRIDNYSCRCDSEFACQMPETADIAFVSLYITRHSGFINISYHILCLLLRVIDGLFAGRLH